MVGRGGKVDSRWLIETRIKYEPLLTRSFLNPGIDEETYHGVVLLVDGDHERRESIVVDG